MCRHYCVLCSFVMPCSFLMLACVCVWSLQEALDSGENIKKEGPAVPTELKVEPLS